MGAKVHGDAAPALKLVRVGRAVGHATAFVVVVEAGGARGVTVGFGAAAQALAVATLALVGACLLAVAGTYWRRHREDGGKRLDHDAGTFFFCKYSREYPNIGRLTT